MVASCCLPLAVFVHLDLDTIALVVFVFPHVIEAGIYRRTVHPLAEFLGRAVSVDISVVGQLLTL